MLENKNKTILVLVFIFILLVVSPLILAFGKTGQKTNLLGKDYSMLTKKQISEKIAKDFVLPESILLTSNNQKFELKLASISAKINVDNTASNMLFRRLNQGFVKYLQSFLLPRDFDLEISYNKSSLDQYLSQISGQLDKPYIPSELVLVSNNEIQYKNGQIGYKVNVQKINTQLIQNFTKYNVSNISIPIDPVGYLPTNDQILVAQKNAQKLIGKSINLVSVEHNITLDDKVLVSWLDFDLSCKGNEINDYISGLKNSVSREPVNAIFRYENNKVLEFKPAKDGHVLDENQLKNLICRKYSDLLNGNSLNIKIDLPLIVTPPNIKNDDVNNLGIKDLLGRGKSTFKHSNATRNMNVEKGASLVNSILVAPGETFSFIKNLGPVSLENGFKKAYVIKEGRTELDVGGGVCQVSTTLFRAMLNSGLDIIARQPHAYRVGYYEEDSPPGFDATVFIPNPDLKFINDTGHHVLIQNTYDGVNKTLVYEIYGTSDGRKAEISNYRKWDASPAPPERYIDDPTLPPGKVIQDEHAVPGLKTAFDWKVTDKSGNIIHQKNFQSSYTPWAAVFRRGPQQ